MYFYKIVIIKGTFGIEIYKRKDTSYLCIFKKYIFVFVALNKTLEKI